jgi:hypothetical protein
VVWLRCFVWRWPAPGVPPLRALCRARGRSVWVTCLRYAAGGSGPEAGRFPWEAMVSKPCRRHPPGTGVPRRSSATVPPSSSAATAVDVWVPKSSSGEVRRRVRTHRVVRRGSRGDLSARAVVPGPHPQPAQAVLVVLLQWVTVFDGQVPDAVRGLFRLVEERLGPSPPQHGRSLLSSRGLAAEQDLPELVVLVVAHLRAFPLRDRRRGRSIDWTVRCGRGRRRYVPWSSHWSRSPAGTEKVIDPPAGPRIRTANWPGAAPGPVLTSPGRAILAER